MRSTDHRFPPLSLCLNPVTQHKLFVAVAPVSVKELAVGRKQQMVKQSSPEPQGRISLDRLFAGAATATFVIELLGVLVLIGAVVGYVLVISGVWDIIKTNTDIVIFLLLVGGAIAFAVFIAFFGFFSRFHGRVKGFVVGKGIGRIATGSTEGRTILSLFAFSVVFFFAAGCYGVYLLWKYILIPVFYASSIYLRVIFVVLAVILVCLMVQAAAAGVGRYAARVTKRLSA